VSQTRKPQKRKRPILEWRTQGTAELPKSSDHNRIINSTIFWFLCKLRFRPCMVAAEGLHTSALQHRSKRHRHWHPPWQRCNPKIYTKSRSEFLNRQGTPQTQKVSFKMRILHHTKQRTNASRCRVRIVATRSSLLVSSDRAEAKIWSRLGLRV